MTSLCLIVNCGSHKKDNTSIKQNEVNIIGINPTWELNGETEHNSQMPVPSLPCL